MSTDKLYGLTGVFTPPVRRSYPVEPNDFSAYRLNYQAPEALVRLFETYGEGTFEDSNENRIRLLFPTESEAKQTRMICVQNRILISEHAGLVEETYTAGGLWLSFDESGLSRTVDCILWARGDDRELYFLVWVSDAMGWVVYIQEDGFTSAFCLFRSPAAVIRQAFDTSPSPLRHMFRRPREPFRFVPDE
jgi:hypothetical protein